MSERKSIKLGKGMRLEYVPFSQLINPWSVCNDPFFCKKDTLASITLCNSRALKTMKKDDLNLLKLSIKQYGLLKPFEVAELTEEILEEHRKEHGLRLPIEQEQKYLILDGQRRYLVIEELIEGEILGVIGLPHERKEETVKEFRLNVRDCILIPCLIYLYKTFLEMRRHSIEDNKFSVKPSSNYLELAERLESGVPSLDNIDVREAMGTIREIWNKKLEESKAKEGISPNTRGSSKFLGKNEAFLD